MSAKKLTAETKRDWRTACERDKRGGYDWQEQAKRANRRAVEWALWKQGNPTLLQSWQFKRDQMRNVVTADVIGAEVVFSRTTHHRSYSQPIRGPRGGLRGYETVPERWETEELARVYLPEWAQPVRDADAWHAQHQAERQTFALAAE